MYSEDLPFTGLGLTVLGAEVGLPAVAVAGLAVITVGLGLLRLGTRSQRA